jgi:hypothetical protein
MQSVLSPRSNHVAPSALTIGIRLGILWLPGLVLLVGCLRSSGSQGILLWLGTAFQILLGCLLVLNPRTYLQPAGPPVIILYLIAMSWAWLTGGFADQWYTHLARSILLVVPLIVFALQILRDSGAMAHRHARLLAERLASRKSWPADLASCRTLPEVKAFREALYNDPTPALMLLKDPRPQVRLAALAALEFRKTWHRGQAELVLQVARQAPESVVRAAAVTALGNVDDKEMVEALAEFLRDPAWEVRRAATEAVLWETETRWSWIRNAVRRALSDPLFQSDGPMRSEGQLLTAEAVADLTAWSSEKGCLGDRAALTLGLHYRRALNSNPDLETINQLKQQLADPHSGVALRLELIELLHQHQELDRGLLEQLLAPVNAAPMRLLAADKLLGMENRHPGALAALRDVARLSNREIALNTADVVQRRLGVDLGLALGQPLPPLHSRLAADVTRRVMAWATNSEPGPQSPAPWSTVIHPG